MGLLHIKINNSKKHAVGGKKWKDPGAKLYDKCLNAFYSDGDVPCGTEQLEQAMKDGTYKQWPDFLKEVYLVAPVNDIKNSPYGVTPFSRSGCKYPHHVIRNGEMVLSIPGVKRAWDMAFYQKSMTPEVKRHLNRHMKELGIEPFFHHGQLYWNESKEIEMKIEDNFLFIENCIKEGIGIDLYCPTDIDDPLDAIYERSHGSLKYEYRIGVDTNNGRLTSVQFKLDPSKITSVGHRDGYEVAHILSSDKRYNAFDRIQTKIDKLHDDGKKSEADELESKLNATLSNATKEARDKALDFVKNNVKKLGHIDYISDESVVDKIFHKDGRSIASVSIIPALSKDLFKFLNYLDDNYDMSDFKVKSPYSYKGKDDGVSFSYTQLFGTSQVRELFVKFCKDNNLQGEKYEVGKLAGKNKYRSTKIMWDASWLYQKYSRSPVLRGNLSPVQINTNKSTYDGMNKPKIRTENTDQIQLSNDLNSEDYIRPLNKNDVRKEHFIGWFFKMNEFVNDDPTTFDLDLLVNNGYIKNYVFGYFIDNNLEGIIKIRYNISINTYAVSMLFVNEDKQHAGIGDALMKHAVSLFGDHDMTLRVFALNTHALSLYKKYDFQVTKTEVYEDGPDQDPKFIGEKMYQMKRDGIRKFEDHCDTMSDFKGGILTVGDLAKYKISEEELEKIKSRFLKEGTTMFEEGDDLDWIESYLMEEGETPPAPPAMPEEPKEESMPKKTDKAESSKNGVRRKNLYIEFIKWCKDYNPKNTFGSIFDKDAFNVTYPFIPDEMRYFYRLANPMLCVLGGNLTFFAAAELRKINAKNSHLNEMMIFAATNEDVRVFNVKDKKIYRGTEENGTLKLNESLGDTFDTYLQKMINKGDILNAPIEESAEVDVEN